MRRRSEECAGVVRRGVDHDLLFLGAEALGQLEEPADTVRLDRASEIIDARRDEPEREPP